MLKKEELEMKTPLPTMFRRVAGMSFLCWGVISVALFRQGEYLSFSGNVAQLNNRIGWLSLTVGIAFLYIRRPELKKRILVISLIANVASAACFVVVSYCLVRETCVAEMNAYEYDIRLEETILTWLQDKDVGQVREQLQRRVRKQRAIFERNARIRARDVWQRLGRHLAYIPKGRQVSSLPPEVPADT